MNPVEDHLGASTYLEKGWSRISAADYAGAEEHLRHALQLAPNSTEGKALLGWALMLQGKYSEARESLQQALQNDPSHGLALVNLGYISLKDGNYAESIEFLSRVIRLNNDPKAKLYAHYYLGLVYAQRQMYEDAQTFFEKTLILGPNFIEAYYELGRAFWMNKQPDRAIKVWQDGYAANKFNPWGRKCGEMLRIVEGGE